MTLPIPQVAGADQRVRAEAAPGLPWRPAVRVERDGLRVLSDASFVPPGQSPVTDAYLLTAVRAPGDVLAAFGGTVRGAPDGALPVRLPPGAEVRGVCVGGHWLNPAACAARDECGAVPVPVPAGPGVRFEVRYRLAPAPGWPVRAVSSPVPEVPGAPPVGRWWSFADGVLPGGPASPWDETPDEPPLLGGPLVSGPPALVIKSDDAEVRVGAVRVADALAAALTVPLVALGLITARKSLSGALALAAAAALALAVVELGPPWWARVAWPVLGAAAVALARVLAVRAPLRGGVPAAGGALLALAFVALEAGAQPLTPATVLIVPGATGGEEVVAPHALLEKLDALARPAPPAPVITSAVYDVQADDTGARVTARFVVHAFRAADNTVTLPLADARLERATVDGAAAFPAAPRSDAYTFSLSGPGRHEIELRFAATVTASGPERELRFGVPEVADAKLTAALPGAARQPQAVGRAGRQVVADGGARTTVGADLGATRLVHLRWREGAGGAAVVKVREGCVWDVTDAGADLNAAYVVRVEQGTIVALRFDVPAELDVLRVAVRASDVPAALALRDWELGAESDGFRPLRLDFQGPVTGRFLVVLECAPLRPPTRQPVLRFPRLVFGPVKGETDAVYALRASRVTVEEVGRGGVIDFSADALRDFATVPDLKLDPNHPVRAFRPVPGAAAELRPTLRAGDPPVVRAATTWTVGPGRADAAGTVSWSEKAPVALIEFALAGGRVLEVRGPDVAGWGRTGERVQVWLRSGAKEGTVEWFGTVAHGSASGAGPRPFEPIAPTFPAARLVESEVRVRSVEGWAVRGDRARGWQTAPAPAGELRFRADGPPPQGLRVQVLPLLPASR